MSTLDKTVKEKMTKFEDEIKRKDETNNKRFKAIEKRSTTKINKPERDSSSHISATFNAENQGILQIVVLPALQTSKNPIFKAMVSQPNSSSLNNPGNKPQIISGNR